MAAQPIPSQAQAGASRALAIVSLCIGVFMIVEGAYFMHRTHLDEFVLHPDAVEGVVRGNRAVRPSGTSYAAVVTFTDTTGRPVTFQDKVAMGLPSFGEGQRVRVFYDPHRPESAMVDRGLKNFIIPAICLAVAGFCFLGAWQRRVARPLR